jgi:hypothetical protein
VRMSQYWNHSKGRGSGHSLGEVNTDYLDCFVPRAGNKDAALGCLKPFDNLHRPVVLGDLLRLPGLNVVEARSIVATTRDNLVPFLRGVVWKELDVCSANLLTLFQQTDRTGAWCPYIAFPWVWPFWPTSYIRTYESRQRANVREHNKGS